MAFGQAKPFAQDPKTLDSRIPILGGFYYPTRDNIRPIESEPDPVIVEQMLKINFDEDCIDQQILDADNPIDIGTKFDNIVKSTTVTSVFDGGAVRMATSAYEKYKKLKSLKNEKGETKSFNEIVMESIKAGAKNLGEKAEAFGKKELQKLGDPWQKYYDNSKKVLEGAALELQDTAQLLLKKPMFVKVLPKSMNTRGYQWRQGLNSIPVFDSNPVNSCSENGLYFTDLIGLSTFMKPNVDVWQVCIPKGAEWVKDPGIQRKWRASQVILVRKYDGPDLSKLAELMNLPPFRVPDLTLPCKTIATLIEDLTDNNFDVVFNNEFFDYALGAVDLVKEFPEQADKWMDADRLLGNIPASREIAALKETAMIGIKGDALKMIKSIDPINDIADNVKAQANECLDGIKEATNKVVTDVKTMNIGVGVGTGSVMKLGAKTSVAKLAAIKKFGF